MDRNAPPVGGRRRWCAGRMLPFAEALPGAPPPRTVRPATWARTRGGKTGRVHGSSGATRRLRTARWLGRGLRDPLHPNLVTPTRSTHGIRAPPIGDGSAGKPEGGRGFTGSRSRPHSAGQVRGGQSKRRNRAGGRVDAVRARAKRGAWGSARAVRGQSALERTWFFLRGFSTAGPVTSNLRAAGGWGAWNVRQERIESRQGGTVGTPTPDERDGVREPIHPAVPVTLTPLAGSSDRWSGGGRRSPSASTKRCRRLGSGVDPGRPPHRARDGADAS